MLKNRQYNTIDRIGLGEEIAYFISIPMHVGSHEKLQ